jgi:uncharacterized protein (TIGR03067 family)
MAKTSRSRGTSVRNEVHEHLEDCWDEPLSNHQPTDLDLLQGAWISISGRREARLLVAGNRFTIQFRDGDIYMGCIEVDSLTQPRGMNLTVEEGPAHHKHQAALGIYELQGDQLLWCTSGPGQKQRPPEFAAEDDPGCLCLMFQRETRNGAR